MRYSPSEPLEQPCVVMDNRNAQLFDDFNIDTAAVADRLARHGLYASDIGRLSIFARFDEVDPDGHTVAADYDQGHITLHTPAIVNAGISTYTADVLQADSMQRKQPYFNLNQHVETAFDQALNNTLQRTVDDLHPQPPHLVDKQRQRLHKSHKRWERVRDNAELLGMGLGTAATFVYIGMWDRSLIETIGYGGVATYVGESLGRRASLKRMQAISRQLTLLNDPEARAAAAENVYRGLLDIEVSAAIKQRAQANLDLERALLTPPQNM